MWTHTSYRGVVDTHRVKGVASTLNPEELTSYMRPRTAEHGYENCNESYNKNRENNKTRNRNRTRIRNRTRTRTRNSTPGALGGKDLTCPFDHVSV